MALSNPISCLVILFMFLVLLPYHANSVSFNFHCFNPNMKVITFQGDAFSSNGVLQLTRNQVDDGLQNSTGQASYSRPVRIWNAKTRKLTDFTTQFSFVIKLVNFSPGRGDGFSFFMAPVDSKIPANSHGGFLGLFNPAKAFNTENQVVALEFDSFQNQWDPEFAHIGVDINSIESRTTAIWTGGGYYAGSVGKATVSYHSSTKNLSVVLSYGDSLPDATLSYVVDLRKVLPEWVRIGFSASTGQLVEIHNILTWKFSSSLDD